eukprot:6010757-Alexandrium_andersonii.AAC.1
MHACVGPCAPWLVVAYARTDVRKHVLVILACPDKGSTSPRCIRVFANSALHTHSSACVCAHCARALACNMVVWCGGRSGRGDRGGRGGRGGRSACRGRGGR